MLKAQTMEIDEFCIQFTGCYIHSYVHVYPCCMRWGTPLPCHLPIKVTLAGHDGSSLSHQSYSSSINTTDDTRRQGISASLAKGISWWICKQLHQTHPIILSENTILSCLGSAVRRCVCSTASILDQWCVDVDGGSWVEITSITRHQQHHHCNDA